MNEEKMYYKCTKCEAILDNDDLMNVRVKGEAFHICPFCKTDEHLKNIFFEDARERSNRIIERIKEIAQDEVQYWEADGDGVKGELYAYYDDRAQPETVAKWLQDEHPLEAFWEFIDEWWGEAVWDLKQELRKEIIDKLEEEIAITSVVEELLDNWLLENAYVALPADHYLKQNYHVNIMIDTGDANYDFTLANDFGSGEDFKIPEKSPLLWLAKQQGYTEQELYDVFKGTVDNNFLKSLVQEYDNLTCFMGGLTFLVNLTLKELLDIQEAINEKKPFKLKIDKSAMCGLFNPWNGSGSILEIELERDVIIPGEMVYHIGPDAKDGTYDSWRYDVDSVYGLIGKAWDGDCHAKIEVEGQ